MGEARSEFARRVIPFFSLFSRFDFAGVDGRRSLHDAESSLGDPVSKPLTSTHQSTGSVSPFSTG